MAHVGAAHTRVEDDRFLTGRGRFVDDIRLPGEVYAAFVRSPHARARLGAIATDRARAMPGVLAVLTGEDWRRDGGGETDVLWDITSHDGSPMALARRPVFAAGEARHVGDTVALVVAEDPHAAADAAAAVDVAWEPLPSITDLAASVEPDAPLVHEEFGSNVAYDWRLGDAEATAAAFAAAAHVTSLKLVNNRLAPSAPWNRARPSARTIAAASGTPSGPPRRTRIWSASGSRATRCARPSTRSEWWRPMSAAASAKKPITIPRRRACPGPRGWWAGRCAGPRPGPRRWLWTSTPATT